MPNLLHILQPKSHHEEANLIANREGLIALKNAIDEALTEGSIYTGGFFHSDGEGYEIFIHLVDADCHKNSENIPLPYDSDIIGNQKEQWAWLMEDEEKIIKKQL